MTSPDEALNDQIILPKRAWFFDEMLAEVRKEELNPSLVAWRNSVVI